MRFSTSRIMSLASVIALASIGAGPVGHAHAADAPNAPSIPRQDTGGDEQDGNGDAPPDDAAPPLALGDRGQLVAWWQDNLNEWLQLSGSDTYPIVVDGWYGPNTEAATLEFQTAHDTVDDDGIVNPVDRVALRDAIDALATDDAPPVGEFSTDAATSSNFPLTGDPALLEEVLFGAEAGGDRLIFEFGDDDGELSYEIQYVDSAIAASGEPVDVGDGPILQVTALPASGVDLSGAEAEVIYTGPERIDTSDTLTHVDELVSVLDFEGTIVWAADLAGDAQAPFRAQVMEEPLRLVIDIASRDEHR